MPEVARSDNAGKETARKMVRERAKAEAEAVRQALVTRLEKQDERRRDNILKMQARVQQRLAKAFDPMPALRPMYDDDILAKAAKVPGPGAYSPRMPTKGSAGKTFGSGPNSVRERRRDAESPGAWKVKNSAQSPGPASYSPLRQTHMRGSTFGLPPRLTHGKVVPSAHDMSLMVAHLRELPAPDAYSPRNPVEKNKGFRIRPSKARSSLEQQILDASKIPGPGAYDLSKGLSAGRSTILGGSGMVKSELELVMERAKQLPGPGAYSLSGGLRSRGSPRFSGASGASLIETIIMDAQTKPGPGTYHQTPTFEEELKMRRYQRAVIKGEISIESPRSSCNLQF